MDVRDIDVCIVQGFRLTDYQVFVDNKIVESYFNIRDEQGVILGNNYDDVDTPLKILLSIWYELDNSFILDTS